MIAAVTRATTTPGSELIARVWADRQARVVVLVLLVAGLLAWGAWHLWQRSHDGRPPVATTTATRRATNPDGRVRVATWNLRKFSERDGAGEYPPDLVAIARVIKDNAFDVVAIQEVQRQGQMAEKLRRQLNEPWRIEVSEQTGEKLRERYAFLYRGDRVDLVDRPKLLDGPEAGQFDRRPALATFRSGSFDFTLVTAHLWYGDKANNAKRRQEAAALARFAKDLAARGPERDVIVLGDFNEVRSGGNLHLFESNGWIKLNQREPTNLGSTEIYDNVLIDIRRTREYADQSGVVKFDEQLFPGDDRRAASEVSDHRPVWADFATTMADDD
jgi:endonuclease/exonuclease/phosphatase family metal-dependent hydrolase